MSLVFRSSLAFRSTRTLPSTSRAILERSISRTKTPAGVLPRVDAQIQFSTIEEAFASGRMPHPGAFRLGVLSFQSW
jgi:hypothetical protein